MSETSTTQKKAKKLCYERRASSIIKKSKELQILCDVKVGVVILGPDGKLESCWPPRLSNVKALFDACKECPNVKSQKRKSSPENSSQSCHEILVSKLQLLKQREELLFKSGNKGKEIATTSQAKSERYREILNSKLHFLNNREMLLNSKQIIDSMETIESPLFNDFREGCPVIMNSKLGILNRKEMVFINGSRDSAASVEAKEMASMERFKSLCDGVVAYGQDTQKLYDDVGGEFAATIDGLFNWDNFEADQQDTTVKGKEIATMENMDSGILQDNAHHLGVYQKPGPYFDFGAHQYEENVIGELTSMNFGFGPNQWHHGSNSVNHTLQKSFTALDNSNLPSLTFWQYMLKNSGPQTSTEASNSVVPLVESVDLCKLHPRKNLVQQNSADALDYSLSPTPAAELMGTSELG